MEAGAIKDKDRHLGVVLAFNVKVLPDARDEADANHIRIFENRIIYSLIEGYTDWVKEDSANEEDAVFSELTPVSRFTFMKGMVFRNSGPAVFGIAVDVGTLRQKTPFMNAAGRRVGVVHQLQLDKKTVPSARAGDEVACSVQDVTIGRQLFEEDVYYTFPSSREAKMLLGRFTYKLGAEEQEVLAEIVRLQRERDAAYGY